MKKRQYKHHTRAGKELRKSSQKGRLTLERGNVGKWGLIAVEDISKHLRNKERRLNKMYFAFEVVTCFVHDSTCFHIVQVFVEHFC